MLASDGVLDSVVVGVIIDVPVDVVAANVAADIFEVVVVVVVSSSGEDGGEDGKPKDAKFSCCGFVVFAAATSEVSLSEPASTLGEFEEEHESGSVVKGAAAASFDAGRSAGFARHVAPPCLSGEGCFFVACTPLPFV